MAENKKSFIAYVDWKSTFDLLTDEEAGKLIKHIFSFVSDENPSLSDRILQLSFSHIEQDLKRDLKKWENYIDKQKANGKKGGRPKTQKTQAFNEKPKKADNVNVNVNDNVNVNELSKDNHIPKWLEFLNYAQEKCLELNYSLDESKLKSKYLAWKEAGWKTGKDKKIKNWKSTLLNTLIYLRKEKQDERINIGDLEAWSKL